MTTQPTDPTRHSSLGTESCLGCNTDLAVRVCQSAAGYYIGTSCDNCGPHSRFSGYTRKEEEAEQVLKVFLETPCRLASYSVCNSNLPSIEWLCCERAPGEFVGRRFSISRSGRSR